MATRTTPPRLADLEAAGRPLGRGRIEVELEGRALKLSNLDKVLWPKTGTTKRDLIDYVLRVSPVLLTHVRGRPLTLKRYPDGVDGIKFFEKRCPSHRPDWVETEPIWSDRHKEMVCYCVVRDTPTLVWLANLACIEMHVNLHVAGAFDRPTVMVFDLDPGPGTDIVECCQVAKLVRTTLKRAGMLCFPKTSGSKGLQVYVPLNSEDVTFEQEAPELVVSRMTKSLREGKVLIDWSQNDPYKTTICAYSTRAKEEPTVSTPVTWAEVQRCVREDDASVLRFTTDDVLRRVSRRGDLFADVATVVQSLPA